MRRVAGGPLAILLVCLLVIAVAAALVGSSRPNDVDPSSRSAGNAGTLALFQWLSRLGLPVERMSGDFQPQRADVLVVSNPSTAFTPDDAAKVAAMVRAGGVVLLAVDRVSVRPAAELLSALSASPNPSSLLGESSQPAAYDAVPAVPVDPAGLVHRVPMQAGLDFDVEPGAAAPLLVHDGQTVAMAIPLGSGRAFVLGSPYPISNLGLRQKDSALFVLSLIDRARGGHVVFDEVHHGETGVSGARAALSGPVGLAGLLAALAIFLWLLLSGRRLGRALPAVDPARVPSATEYVDALGALIERTSQRGGIADRFAEELKQRVGAATAIDAHLDDEPFLVLLEGYDATAAAPVRTLLGRCRDLAAGRPSDAQLVALAREVDEVEAAFAVGGGLPHAVAGGARLASFRG
jgi:Domain of unknown function (DUF4350)